MTDIDTNDLETIAGGLLYACPPLEEGMMFWPITPGPTFPPPICF